MITACPISTIVGVLNGMATTTTLTTGAKQRVVATTVVADAQTMTLTSKSRRETKNRMLNLRPSYFLVKQPAKAP